MEKDAFDYYASHSSMSDLRGARAVFDSLPNDPAALSRVIQGLGVYDVVARDFYGFEPPPDRLNEIHLRPVAQRVGRMLTLDSKPLHVRRPPERRALGRCNSFALLLVSMLRDKGVPARSRCGFAAYFNPPKFEDHWVCEYWDAQDRRWRLVDPQIDNVWRNRLDIRIDTLDLPRTHFLAAGEAWRRCRSGEADEESFGISFAGLRGLWFVAGSLVRDMAALNKMEMAPWDVWGVQPGPADELDFAFFDGLAALTSDPDATFPELRRRYEADDGLRVPAAVFNALTGRREAIGVDATIRERQKAFAPN